MKNFKKICCFIIPLVLAFVVIFGIITFVNAESPEESPMANVASASDYNGQVVYGSSDTGAATAAKGYKGGSMYLEPYCKMTIKGGVYSGHSNTYGGAIYISKGARLTISGGTIKSNKATFGGAIYVENGGTLVLEQGTKIIENTAEQGSAIYIEEGGTLIDNNPIIEDNITKYNLRVSIKKYLGATVTLDGETYKPKNTLYTINFGSYPNSYVESPLSDTLENIYAGRETDIKYVVNSTTWQGYRHTDGNIYVRGTQTFASGLGYTYYKNLSVYSGPGTAWFKVEPITWYILNYNKWVAGEEDVELISETAVTGIDKFSNADYHTLNQKWQWQNNPYIRRWLNDSFYNSAFTSREKSIIKLSTIYNNQPGNFNSVLDKITGIDKDLESLATQDYVYIPSYKEMKDYAFKNLAAEPDSNYPEHAMPERLCRKTDFCLANGTMINSSGTTNVEIEFGDGYTQCATYWLRSEAYSGGVVFCGVGLAGQLYSSNGQSNALNCVRPVIQLNIGFESVS